jgi:hypothetical protein
MPANRRPPRYVYVLPYAYQAYGEEYGRAYTAFDPSDPECRMLGKMAHRYRLDPEPKPTRKVRRRGK